MGAEGHRRLQKSRPDQYKAELYLSKTVARGRLSLEITGRADGVFTKERPPILPNVTTIRCLSMLSMSDLKTLVNILSTDGYAINAVNSD